MLNGINHITITVNNLDELFTFYVNVLGMISHAKWNTGAYISLDNMWFCLSLDDVSPTKGYCHLAFDISDSNFEIVKAKIFDFCIGRWTQNISEGKSLSFLDPNGHKFELHVGNLNKRLAFLKTPPNDGFKFKLNK